MENHRIIFSRHTSSRDIHELIAQAANVNKHAIITLRDRNGAHVSVSPTMPQNTSANPYKVHAKDPPAPSARDKPRLKSNYFPLLQTSPFWLVSILPSVRVLVAPQLTTQPSSCRYYLERRDELWTSSWSSITG
ncbi:hypothetical protein RRG08_000990 [Elysia crispata]|uniref:Uncharacterized protein n=1 Tax=Elysia crispata TaxID=231223 RepID=A0AAE1DRM3_9GAST|nr:hypothetical protein RRG08_000990 [Elysia crispata]